MLGCSMWKDIITLRSETTVLDEYKRPYKTFVDKEVQARKMSVKFFEFYQAAATGLKPEVIFEVKVYQGESHIIHQGKQYRILRVHPKLNSCELTCTSILNESEYIQ